MQDTKLATIHDINGTDAVTTTEARVIEELIMQGGLKPIITFMNILKAMSVARQIGDDAGYKEVSRGYKEAFNEAVDMLNTKQGTIAAKAELPKPQRTDAKPCVHCGTKIVWLTSDGKSLPIAADSVQQGEKVYSPNKHVRHMFSDCNEVKKANKSNKFTPPDAETRKDQAKLF
jgi:hypothetical protein